MYKQVYYPDGTFYPILNEFPKEFTFRINSYSDLWLLKQIKDVYDHNSKNAIVTIPNLLDAQADRRFNSNESANLKLVLKELNSMNWEMLKIFHPHNSEIVEAIIDKVEIIDNSEFIKQVILSIIDDGNFSSMENFENKFILASTDSGGFKPLMKLVDKIGWKGETYSASKSRKFKDNVSKLIQHVDRNDFNGKSILLIDDICVKGGTFLGLSTLFKERNIRNIYLAVSHITVDKPNHLLWESFDKVFTTNSKNTFYFNEFNLIPTNLEIINLF